MHVQMDTLSTILLFLINVYRTYENISYLIGAIFHICICNLFKVDNP